MNMDIKGCTTVWWINRERMKLITIYLAGHKNCHGCFRFNRECKQCKLKEILIKKYGTYDKIKADERGYPIS